MGYRSILRDDCFRDETIVVTGGGSGIGRCIAHELASLGAHVVVTGRKQEKLDRVLAEIVEDGGSAEARAFDVMREVFAQSMKAHGGAMVNMAADMWRGMPGMAHSGAARAGMVNLTKTCAYEWGQAGVRVNCVAPGWVASSGMDTYEGMTRALIPQLKKHVPLGRLAVEAEVSAVVCFLLSPASSFVTGVTVPIDGGAPLGSPLYPIRQGRGTTAFDGFHRAVTPEVLTGDAG